MTGVVRWAYFTSVAAVLGVFGTLACTTGTTSVSVDSLPTTATTDDFNVTLIQAGTLGRDEFGRTVLYQLDTLARQEFGRTVGRPEQGKYWASFELNIENRSRGERSLLLASFRLVTRARFEIAEPWFYPSGVDRLSNDKMLPGSRTRGFVLFEISIGDSPKILIFDPNPLTTDDIHFELPSPPFDQ